MRSYALAMWERKKKCVILLFELIYLVFDYFTCFNLSTGAHFTYILEPLLAELHVFCVFFCHFFITSFLDEVRTTLGLGSTR